MDAALAASIFHCYMGRTMCMISLASGGDEECEEAAVLHACHVLRIVQGVEEANKAHNSNEHWHMSSGGVR
jgi:hypothetical protein